MTNVSLKVLIAVFHSLSIIFTLLLVAISIKSVGAVDDSLFFYLGSILAVQVMVTALSYLDLLMEIDGCLVVLFLQVRYYTFKLKFNL